jgi:hypothetical protein
VIDLVEAPLPSLDDCMSGRAVRPEHRVRCRLTALGGCLDSVVAPERLRPWVFYSEHGPSSPSSCPAPHGECPALSDVDEPLMRPCTPSSLAADADADVLGSHSRQSHPGARVFLDPSGHHFYLLDPAGGAQWASQVILETCLSVMQE